MTTSTKPDQSPESFQLPLEAAEFYESAFVPAFFAQWASAICDAARLEPGQAVLDVACGTGIVARTALQRVSPGGTITGLDLNEAMLTVARRVVPGIEFRQGDAAALPFPDESFDAVVCQMAMMFFPDRALVARELARVVRVGGLVAVLVPGQLAHQAAFAPFADMAARHAGPEAMSLLGTYFSCGDLDALQNLFTAAGLEITQATTDTGTYRAPSVDDFVTTEVESTPLIERISDEVYARIRAGAREVLEPFTSPTGAVEAPFESNVVVARRP